MSASSRGSARERQAQKRLEDEGWAVTKSGGSRGCADLWAAKGVPSGYMEYLLTTNPVSAREVVRSELRLVQVKTDKRNPYDHFGPKEREALIALGDQTGGTPELWWWPANKPLQVIPEAEWPRAKVAA